MATQRGRLHLARRARQYEGEGADGIVVESDLRNVLTAEKTTYTDYQEYNTSLEANAGDIPNLPSIGVAGCT